MNKDVHLTIDIDWASDEILEYTMSLLRQYDISATFFVTHETPLLRQIRENKSWELGIHPNFNKLLLGESSLDYMRVIDDILQVVPEAVSARSHALTQGSIISQYSFQRGILYESNTYIPASSPMILSAYTMPSGCTCVPFFFEDDVWFSKPEEQHEDVGVYFRKEGLKVFNFHPIHIFLNTENPERYSKAKNYHKLVRNDSTSKRGAEDVLKEMFAYAKTHNFTFKMLNQLETCQ